MFDDTTKYMNQVFGKLPMKGLKDKKNVYLHPTKGILNPKTGVISKH